MLHDMVLRALGVGVVSSLIFLLYGIGVAHAETLVQQSDISKTSGPYNMINGSLRILQPIGEVTSTSTVTSVSIHGSFSTSAFPAGGEGGTPRPFVLQLVPYTDATLSVPIEDRPNPRGCYYVLPENQTRNGDFTGFMHLYPANRGTSYLSASDPCIVYPGAYWAIHAYNSVYAFGLNLQGTEASTSAMVVSNSVDPFTYTTNALPAAPEPDFKMAYWLNLNNTTPTLDEPGCTENCNSNVMFLPGLQASELYAPGLIGENTIWLPNSLTGADTPALDMANSDSKNEVYTRENSIIDYAYGSFGIYAQLILRMNSLKVNGLIEDWAPVAYDWRLDFDDLIAGGRQTQDGKIYYRGDQAATTTDPFITQKLKQLSQTSRTGKVTIIAHSNGGLLAKALLQKPGLSQYVDKVILVASPQLGTPKAIGGISHGYGQGLPSNILSPFLSPANARVLALNTPSAYNLLPSPQYFSVVADPVIKFDSNAPLVWKESYGTEIDSSDEMKAFLADASQKNGNALDLSTPAQARADLLENSSAGHEVLDVWTPPDGVTLITVAGWGKETFSAIEYSNKITGCLVSVGDVCQKLEYGDQITYSPVFVVDGDGTVVEPSALWRNGAAGEQYWVNLMKFNEGFLQEAQHANILQMAEVESLLEKIIVGSTSTLPQYITTTKPTYEGESRLHFVLHSPLNLAFIDSAGKITGATPEGDVSNVPGVTYERLGEVQWISVPRTTSGTITMQGVASGSFQIDLSEVRDNIILRDVSFAAVPNSTSTKAVIEVSPSIALANSELRIDTDGNGTFDRRMVASLAGVVTPDLSAPEAIISVSTSTHEISINGLDNVSSSTSVEKTTSFATISDEAGNVTTLFFKKSYTGNLLSYVRITGINYGTSTLPLLSSFVYIWDSSKNLVSQTVVVDKQFGIQALYDKKKGKTTIIVLKKNLPIKSQVLSGQRIVKLTTHSGGVSYSW